VLTRDSEKKAQKQAAKEEQRAAEQAEKERQEFFASPVGQARTAHEAGDMFFQFAAPISETKRTAARREVPMTELARFYLDQHEADPVTIDRLRS
jgi:hypothetical protein